MSAVVVVRLSVAPESLASIFESRRDDFERVAKEARAAGAIHHEFVAGDGEVLIIDEWDRGESFNKFFGSQTTIAEMMAQVGVQGPSAITVYELMDSPDRF